MNKKHALIIPIVTAALALGGCASDSKRFVNLNLNYVNSNAAVAGNQNRAAQAQLSEAATSVSSSLQSLEAIQHATHPGVHMGHPVNAKAIGMAQRASITWSGPVRPLLNSIARASGYKVKTLGKKPAIPVLVNISAQNQTLATILRQARYQVTGKANIYVYPRKRIIELRYK